MWQQERPRRWNACIALCDDLFSFQEIMQQKLKIGASGIIPWATGRTSHCCSTLHDSRFVDRAVCHYSEEWHAMCLHSSYRLCYRVVVGISQTLNLQ